MNQTVLEKYARLLAGVGINVKEGERVLVNADTESLPLVRELVRVCWQRGASDVITRLSDNEILLARYEEAGEEALDYFPSFEADYREEMLKAKYHRIHVSVPSLDYFAQIGDERIRRDQKAALTATEHLEKYMQAGDIKWTVAAFPSVRWARELFPDLEEERALERLWEEVLRICRLDSEDPVAAWEAHDALLKERENRLDEKAFDYLHFEGPGTDLICHLAEGHKWIGGSSQTPEGDSYMANIPTEELFTTPHALKVEGKIRSTMPLSVMGKIIEDFGFSFKEGKVVDYYAGKNGGVLEAILDMDEGARRLGEVALVADSSPVSQAGLLFKSTLYDENASCHFALGQAYAEAVRGGASMTEEERQALGSNKSMVHIDFMVGGPRLDVTGYKEGMAPVTLLKGGEWAF